MKLSYNSPADPNVVGGICGTCFFVKPGLALTATHVLSREKFIPNSGFSYAQFWILIEPNLVFELRKSQLDEFPEIDTTLIKFSQDCGLETRPFCQGQVTVGQQCYNEGFIANKWPTFTTQRSTKGITISACSFDGSRANAEGFVAAILRLNTVATDVHLRNALSLELSYGGRTGMSGGPLLSKASNAIIGLISIGIPPGAEMKRRLYAISIDEIKRVVEIASPS